MTGDRVSVLPARAAALRYGPQRSAGRRNSPGLGHAVADAGLLSA
jgi:hypothetical protein